jgi:hypothetical protein
MGFTLQALDNGVLVFEIPLNHTVNIFKTGDDAKKQKDDREIGERSELPVQPVAQIEASKYGQNHGDADTAGIGHLEHRRFIQLHHFRGAS